MTTFEKAGAVFGVVASAFLVGAGWNALNNRIDGVDTKIAGIQKTLGSTACTSILTRQIEAIERARENARAALEKLSEQYHCIPTGTDGYPMDAAAYVGENAALAVELNSVDALLNEER